jgi:hypothetical protein
VAVVPPVLGVPRDASREVALRRRLGWLLVSHVPGDQTLAPGKADAGVHIGRDTRHGRTSEARNAAQAPLPRVRSSPRAWSSARSSGRSALGARGRRERTERLKLARTSKLIGFDASWVVTAGIGGACKPLGSGRNRSVSVFCALASSPARCPREDPLVAHTWFVGFQERQHRKRFPPRCASLMHGTSGRGSRDERGFWTRATAG